MNEDKVMEFIANLTNFNNELMDLNIKYAEEILSRLERIDHKEYSCGFEFADSSTFDEMARCFEERKILAKEIERLTELCNKYEEEHKTTFETWQKDIKEIEKLQQCIKDDKENADEIISEQAKEIERLNNQLDYIHNKYIDKLEKIVKERNSIIKEAREYIESYIPNYDFDKTNLIKLLEILQGSEKE